MHNSKYRTICLLVFCSGCATDHYITQEGHALFNRGDYKSASKSFQEKANTPSTNQLLYLLDSCSSYFAAQEYALAIPCFLKAEKLAEIKDYTSISEEIGVLGSSDNIRGYKGEDFEKVLINVYLALSFSALENWEGAQVESRKINYLLQKMITEGKRNYQESPFARYLSAILWEQSGNKDDAYIDYKYCAQLDPQFTEIGDDLLAYDKKWKEKYPGAQARTFKKSQGELILIFERGISPIKVPRNDRNSSLPEFQSRFSSERSAQLRIGEKIFPLSTVLDIEKTSTLYLEDRISRMTGAKIAGTFFKGALAYGIGSLTKSEDLGWLSFYALLFADQADLRSWRTLPATLDMTRVAFDEGKYHLFLDVLGPSGTILRTKEFNIKITKGKKHFLIAR